MTTNADLIKVGDKPLSVVLDSIAKQVAGLEVKFEQFADSARSNQSPVQQATAGSVSNNSPDSAELSNNSGPAPNSEDTGLGPNYLLGSDTNSPSEFDIQKRFDNVREGLSRIQLPPDSKVCESQQGIKADCKSTLKVISRSARFAETGLKLMSRFCQDDQSGNFIISPADMDKLYIIFQAQVNYLQAEYSGLVVRSTFDEETSRLFRAFQNNSQAFSERSLNHVRLAAELTSISTRHSSNARSAGHRGQRSSFGRRPFGRVNRGFARGGYYPFEQSSTFPERPSAGDQL